MMPGSGAYSIKNEDVINQESYKLTKNDDFWAKDHKQNRYQFNFDAINFFVIKDNYSLTFEKFKKGEFDYYEVARSRVWVEDCVPEKMNAIDKGWMKKHRIFSDKPTGTISRMSASYDLLVIGTPEKNNWIDMLFGTGKDEIVENAPCSILRLTIKK